MTNRQKKGEGQKLKKIEYLENEKSFLDEIKSIFHSFWRAIIWWKNKDLMKTADTSFKIYRNKIFGGNFVLRIFGQKGPEMAKKWVF